MRRVPLVVAAAALIALAGVGVAIRRAERAPAPSLAGLVRIAHGARRGRLLAGPVAGLGRAALYEPAAARHGHGVRAVFIDAARGAPVRFARGVHLAETGDQLIWDGSTPPFVAVVADASSSQARHRVEAWTRAVLPIAGSEATWLQVPSRHAESLEARLVRALQSPRVRRSSAAARAVAPARFTRLLDGPDGGTMWSGRIPGKAVPALRRQSIVYLPPNVRRDRRYPLVILLHGLRGSPYSFAGGVRMPAVADPLIAAHRVRAFIAVMPPAGLTPAFDGEWTGAWERYVVDDVVPWAGAHLPVARDRAGRVIAGFSAGGYGAVDMALRHPRMFGVAESWSGYFDAPHDGSLRHATLAARRAHAPTVLARRERRLLRRLGLRVLVSAGRGEPDVLRASRRFGAELVRLRLPSHVLVMRGRHDGRQWHALLGPALRYALPDDGLAGR
ncbi:MAG TPA: alpha/beta hydrolase-fold protein [Gaiellales bacterium]|jgi:enterochelin esterase-like enzyme